MKTAMPLLSFNTQPPEGGWEIENENRNAFTKFQHTAARRRLVLDCNTGCCDTPVSTHSRPKAAGLLPVLDLSVNPCFNTQPPEGGW